MGLFSGGGFLGKVGGALGLNTSAQEKAIKNAAGAQVGRLQESAEEFRPFVQAGLGALPGIESGATLEGFAGNIEDIFSSGILDSLIEERQRGASSAAASAGLTRSGAAIQEAADIPTDLAFQIEQLLSGRLGALGSTGLDATGSMANIRSGIGAAQSSGILGQAQAKQAGRENIAGTASGGLSAAGGAGLLGGLGRFGAVLGALSDIRLKKNIKAIGTIGGLTICEWDWIDGVHELLKDTGLMNAGFIAQDVEELYPQFSGEFHGFKTIDYPGLIEALKWSH